ALRLKHRSGSCGTASAAPCSPYRHLELYGIALTPPRDGSWAGIGNQNKQARVRRTANGYEVQLFTHGDDNVHGHFPR
ncbi:hypothetical protein, partial [Gemmiger formicilis]